MSERPERNPKLAWREIGGEIVIISPDDSQVHELNETASLVWKQADGTRTRDEIAAAVAKEFEVDLAAAAADVAELTTVLREKQLLLNGSRRSAPVAGPAPE
jgi:Coenzyme PQQ synthesis protein D (PqqD)